MTVAELAAGIRAGDRRALARGISLVTDGGAETLLSALGDFANPPVVGLTGAPGAGKSTLLGALARLWVEAGRKVCVLAVDPSSPITGGALLGDRLRLGELAADERVYVRSLAARGHLGGLVADFGALLRVVAAAGFDVLVVETVGVGQSEVEVMRYADPVVLAVAPGQGDDIQAAKAGVLEIADIVVVTKSDLPAAERALVELQHASLAAEVVAVSALHGDGVVELWRRLPAAG